MMKTILTISALMIFQCLLGQGFSFPILKKIGYSINELFPPNWLIIDSCFGDLNNDKIADAAFIIEFKDSVQEIRADSLINKAPPRILAVYLKSQLDNTYRLLVQNNTFILRYGEGGMDPEPHGEVSIEHQILTITYQFIRASAEYKFRYQQNDLYLIGATNADVTAGEGDSWDINFMTKKGKHEWGSIASDKEKSKWVSLPNLKIKRLRDLTIPFEWEILPDLFI